MFLALLSVPTVAFIQHLVHAATRHRFTAHAQPNCATPTSNEELGDLYAGLSVRTLEAAAARDFPQKASLAKLLRGVETFNGGRFDTRVWPFDGPLQVSFFLASSPGALELVRAAQRLVFEPFVEELVETGLLSDR